MVKRPISLPILFVFEALTLGILALPSNLNFMAWAFSDQGANLTAQYLTAHGYRANIDFAYHYGLLPLLLGRIWFSLSGATPHACVLLVFLCTLAAAWALARIAVNLELGITGVAFLVIALPLAIPFNPPNLAHALEAALLSNALAEQAAQRHSRSLALATAGLFVKTEHVVCLWVPATAALAMAAQPRAASQPPTNVESPSACATDGDGAGRDPGICLRFSQSG